MCTAGLICNAYTENALGFYADTPSKFGMPIEKDSLIEVSDVTSDKSSALPSALPASVKATAEPPPSSAKSKKSSKKAIDRSNVGERKSKSGRSGSAGSGSSSRSSSSTSGKDIKANDATIQITPLIDGNVISAPLKSNVFAPSNRGSIYVGMADIADLSTAKSIRAKEEDGAVGRYTQVA